MSVLLVYITVHKMNIVLILQEVMIVNVLVAMKLLMELVKVADVYMLLLLL